MELTVKGIPKFIRSLSFSPRSILADVNNVDYLIQTKENLFGLKCCEAAKKIHIDLFDLVFVNEKPFCDCCEGMLKKQNEQDIDVLKTAILLKRMNAGDTVRIAGVSVNGDIAAITDPEYVSFNIGNFGDGKSGRKRAQKAEDPDNKDIPLNKHATLILESLRLAAMKYAMQRCMTYKEMIDAYNFERFSKNLRLNNRPAELEEINAAMSLKKNRFKADLSKDKTRINFTVLYALTYGGYTMEEIFSKKAVIDRRPNERNDKRKKLSDLCGELLTILYNGNGIEISGMMINMIVNFSRIKLPPVDLSDTESIINNYPIYYAATNLAAVCENIFRLDSDQNGEMKEYVKRRTFFNYWTVMDRLMQIKQYSAIVSLCYRMSNFDVELYREDPEYQGSILYAYESTQKFVEELKNNG